MANAMADVPDDTKEPIEALEPPAEWHAECAYCNRKHQHVHWTDPLVVRAVRMAEYPSSDPT